MAKLIQRARTLAATKTVLFVAVVALVFGTYLTVVWAATLTTPRDYLDRQRANLNGNGAEAVTHQIFLTTPTALNGTTREIRVIFPDGDDGKWCSTAGSLTVTGIANPTGATESATSLPGSPTGTCAQGSGSGAAESNRDRLLITAFTATSAATKYGFQAVGNVGKLGTGLAGNDLKVTINTYVDSTLTDTGVYALSLIADDQVVVTATVDPSLTVALNSNTAALGTLSTSNINQAGVTSTVSTNALTGYVSLVKYDVTLTSGGNTIPDTSGGTIVAGTSEYGASSSKAGNTIGIWSPTSCATTGTTSNATALTTAFQSFASAGTAQTTDVTTLCFLASTTATQAPGTYTSTATLVTTAKF